MRGVGRALSRHGGVHQNLFVGPSVTLSRESGADGQAQAVVTLSKNANVANGEAGAKDAAEVVGLVGNELGLPASSVLIASTGVIGQPYPMEKIRAGLKGFGGKLAPADFVAVAKAMMTTDTHHKISSRRLGDATLVGVAKGVGMCEPNMATILTYYFTDADVRVFSGQDDVDTMFKRVIDKTFNAITVDSDTSTSDSAILLANGLAGPVDAQTFESA